MANKNTGTGEGSPNTDIKVGGQGAGTSRWFTRLSSKRLLLVGGACLLLIIIVSFVFLQDGSDSPDQKVYAEVAGHKIYKPEVDKMQQTEPTATDRQVTTTLADKYLTEAMAKKQHVRVSQTDIDSANIANTPKSESYSYQNLVNQVYLSKLNTNNQGIYKGKVLVANFSRNIPYQSGLLAQQKAAHPNLGNATAIAADKKYALTLITNLYNQVKSKKITFDQAMQIEQNDPTLGSKAYPSLYHSQAFNGTLNATGPLAANSIKQQVEAIRPGQLTEPFAVKTPDSAYDPKSTTESSFVVIQMDSKSGGNNGMTFQQEIAQDKKQLGYKINV